jgi:hypothetical protein
VARSCGGSRSWALRVAVPATTQLLARRAERVAHRRVAHRGAGQHLGGVTHQVQRIEKIHQRGADADPLLRLRRILDTRLDVRQQRHQRRPIVRARAGACDIGVALAAAPRIVLEQLCQALALAVGHAQETVWAQQRVVGRARRQVRRALQCRAVRRRRSQMLGADRVALRQPVQGGLGGAQGVAHRVQGRVWQRGE